MTREVIVGAAAEHAVIRKPPSRIVCPVAKAPLAMVPSLKTGRGILPEGDDTEELSMKAPGVGVKTGGSRVGGPELCV